MKTTPEMTKLLYETLANINTEKEVKAFLQDLLTPQEIEQFSQRVTSAKLLMEGKTYNEVIDETNISTATLSRVSRCVQFGKGYKKVLSNPIFHKPVIAVSACLLGINCKYNGQNNYCEKLKEFLKDYEIIKICPESFGKLPIPREPSEIKGDCVYSKSGIDVTSEFALGAKKALDRIRKNGCTIAILKANSPSCGKGTIYDGTFTNTLVSGDGITASLLQKEIPGIKIYNENNFEEINKVLQQTK
jgi:TrpR-related protein YerC/YecD